MENELLQSFVRSGAQVEEDPEPSRLYPPQKEKEKKKVRIETPPPAPISWGRRKNAVVIEQRKFKAIALALDECYCDKDRAASVSFGYMDIKHELKQKHTAERNKARDIPDDSDYVTFMMLGTREIKTGNLESGVGFLNKVFRIVENFC